MSYIESYLEDSSPYLLYSTVKDGVSFIIQTRYGGYMVSIYCMTTFKSYVIKSFNDYESAMSCITSEIEHPELLILKYS